jgi:adenylate cyclase
MKFIKVQIKLPLVFKLVFLTSSLVVAVSLIIAWKNSELFEQISTDREESNAEILTSSKSTEVEAILESYIDKLTTLSFNSNNQKTLSGDLLYYKLDSVNATDALEIMSEKTSSLKLENFQSLITMHQEYLGRVQAGKVMILNSGKTFNEPLLLIVTPVARNGGAITHWAWGAFRMNRLQSSFEKKAGHLIYLLDENGKTLVHPDESQTIASTDLSHLPFISETKNSTLRQKQRYLNEKLISTSKTIYGPLLVSEVHRTSIMAPARLARQTSIFILGIVLSLSFFFSVVFSQQISRHLESLTEFAHQIAGGNFDIRASETIKTKDEIGLLALAFDDMTDGLKERDKIKNMFTKFHGTVVTDELMNQDDMRRGKKCEAVIFFSDIRGFTNFSNDKSPEEVVAMLNSYFEVMVTIINKHGGVVDKFVGDAIMAVWGAPHGTPDDARNAVLACLEMRMALEGFNQKRIQNDEAPILMGMGLHAGMVVTGTVGSNERLEYTVIGDTVNTASRIESSTKSFGTDLLISEEVFKRIGEDFITEFAGSTKVKGKNEPLRLAKVTGYYDEDGVARLIKTPYSQYESESDEKIKVVA